MPHNSINIKAILDNLPENLVLISPNHKVISFNKAMQNTLLPLIGEKLYIDADYRDFVTPGNKSTYLNNFQKVIDGEHIVSQTQVKNGDEYIWYEYEMYPMYDDDQKLIGVTIKSKSIDKEKKGEIELEKLTETLNAIFESTTESILLLDKDYTVLNFNNAAANRLNKQQKHLYIGADFRDFLYEKGQDEFFEMFNKVLNGESCSMEVESVNREGNPIWFQTTMQPTYKKNGELLGVSIITHYITERKIAEIALQESEAKFRKIIESAPMPIIIADDKMNVTLANSETEKVFGYTVEELLNQSIQLLIPKRFQESHKEVEGIYLQNPYTVKHNINRYVPAVKKNGEEIMIEASLSHYQINNRTYIIAIILDVTQRIQHERQIANQLKRFQAIAWQQSHEIRRPLTNILGVCNLIQMETSEEEKQNYLGFAEKVFFIFNKPYLVLRDYEFHSLYFSRKQ